MDSSFLIKGLNLHLTNEKVLMESAWIQVSWIHTHVDNWEKKFKSTMWNRYETILTLLGRRCHIVIGINSHDFNAKKSIVAMIQRLIN